MQSKDDKVGNKTINKEGKEGGKKAREKDRNRFAKETKVQILAFAHALKTIKLFFRLVGKYAFFSRKTRF